MPEDRARVTIVMEGTDGHNGNVLADAFLRKLQKLLTVLARMERVHGNLPQKQTDYQIINAEKYNPTTMEINGIPRVKNYDHRPAFFWSFEQFERVAAGEPVDERIDTQIASELAALAEPERAEGYKSFLLRRPERADIVINEDFGSYATLLARQRRKAESSTQWYEGTSLGSVVGTLRQVGDIEGDLSIVLVPKAGPSQVQCLVPDEWREKVAEYLWKNVRVTGKLSYTKDSPHPASVTLYDVEEIRPPGGLHLLDLEGLFLNSEKSQFDVERLLNG